VAGIRRDLARPRALRVRHDVPIQIADRKIALWVNEKLIHVCCPESVPEDFRRVGFRGRGMKIYDVAVYEVAPADGR
jgi:hypothetical protein